MSQIIDRPQFVQVRSQKNISNFSGSIDFKEKYEANARWVPKKSYYQIGIDVSKATGAGNPRETLTHTGDITGLSNNSAYLTFKSSKLEFNGKMISEINEFPQSLISVSNVMNSLSEVDTRTGNPYTLTSPMKNYTTRKRLSSADVTLDPLILSPANADNDASYLKKRLVENVSKSGLVKNGGSLTFPFPFMFLNDTDDDIPGNIEVRTTFQIDNNYKEGIILSTTGVDVKGTETAGDIKVEVTDMVLWMFMYNVESIPPNFLFTKEYDDIYSTFEPIPTANFSRQIPVKQNTHRIIVTFFPIKRAPALEATLLDNGTAYCLASQNLKSFRMTYGGTQYPSVTYESNATDVGLPSIGTSSGRMYADYLQYASSGSTDAVLMDYPTWLGNMTLVFDVKASNNSSITQALIEADFNSLGAGPPAGPPFSDQSVMCVTNIYRRELSLTYGANQQIKNIEVAYI